MLRQRVRSLLRRFGWDVVRYPPQAPAPAHPITAWAALKRLDIRTVIDVGAFDGDTARVFRETWPNAELHCFEPQAAPYAALQAWAAQQGPQVHTYDFALGDAPGTATMRGITDRPMQASMVRRFEEFTHREQLFDVPIRIERLDDVLKADALTPGVFVKIDVEGFERAVIRGGGAVLDRAAVCMIEVHTIFAPHEAADLAEIAELLRRRGLSFAGMATQHFAKYDQRFHYGDAVFADWSRCSVRGR